MYEIKKHECTKFKNMNVRNSKTLMYEIQKHECIKTAQSILVMTKNESFSKSWAQKGNNHKIINAKKKKENRKCK
jgi:hypothetical protein